MTVEDLIEELLSLPAGATVKRESQTGGFMHVSHATYDEETDTVYID